MTAVSMSQLYRLQPGALWGAFRGESFAFWMSCAYLFFEYIRPQALFTFLQFYPSWASTFVLLAFFGWVFDRHRTFVWTRITTGIFVYLGLVLLSSWTAYWPQVSQEYFMDYFNWVVIFFVLTNTVDSRRRFYILLLIFLLASFKLSQYGARTWALQGFGFSSWGLRGPEGYFENPGELAIQMLVFAPISLFFVLGIRSHLKRWQLSGLSLMPLTAALTVLGTNTRGGQLALAVQVLALLATSRHRSRALLAVALIGFVGYQFIPDEQMERFRSMGEDRTSQQRLLYWEHGWQMMKDHPLLGVGYYNFIPYYNTNHSDDIFGPPGASAELPHNIFVQVGTDTGFLGLTVYVALILGGFTSMRQVRREAESTGDRFLASLSTGMNLALLGYVVAGQFVTVAYYPFLWVHLAFCVMLRTIQRKERVKGAKPARASAYWQAPAEQTAGV